MFPLNRAGVVRSGTDSPPNHPMGVNLSFGVVSDQWSFSAGRGFEIRLPNTVFSVLSLNPDIFQERCSHPAVTGVVSC